MSGTGSWYLSGMYHPSHDEYVALRAEKGRTMARDLIQGKAGVIEAARYFSGLRFDLGPPFEELLRLFVAIDSETDALPIGAIREFWAAEALVLKDEQVRSVDAFYRDAAVETAIKFLSALDDWEKRQKKKPAQGGL